jgi:hypothetical protein
MSQFSLYLYSILDEYHEMENSSFNEFLNLVVLFDAIENIVINNSI